MFSKTLLRASRSYTITPHPRQKEILRLTYQSRHRGTLEADLLLSNFAAKHLTQLSDTQLETYNTLLDENDWDIYYYVTGRKETPKHLETDVMQMLKKSLKEARERKGGVGRMPELADMVQEMVQKTEEKINGI